MSEQEPQVGEWWEIEPGTGHGYNAKYCKIIAASKEEPDSFIVKSIDESEGVCYGFHIRTRAISRFHLKALCLPGLYSTVEANLQDIYGKRARELFERDLKRELAQI